MAERSHPSPYLRQVWHEAACTRLSEAFDDGLGGVPDGLEVRARVERGDAGQVLVDVADQPGDLLVIGSGRRHPVGRALHRSVGRYCLAHAKCPVLAVPPSALMDEMRHGLLPWSLRGRHVLVPDLDDPELPDDVTLGNIPGAICEPGGPRGRSAGLAHEVR